MKAKNEGIQKYVDEFQSEYQDLARAAEVQVEHTSTPGWQALCKAFRDANRQNCSNLAEQLQSAAKLIQERGSSEGVIKSIGDVKKAADEVYETNRHFDLSVISPIRQAALRCQALLANKSSDAERLDSDQPLIWSGLKFAMQDATNRVTRYAWNDEKWIVERIDPVVNDRHLTEAIRDLCPNSVTVSSGGKSVTLTSETREKLNTKLGEPSLVTFAQTGFTKDEQPYAVALAKYLVDPDNVDDPDWEDWSISLHARARVREQLEATGKRYGVPSCVTSKSEHANESDDEAPATGWLTKLQDILRNANASFHGLSALSALNIDTADQLYNLISDVADDQTSQKSAAKALSKQVGRGFGPKIATKFLDALGKFIDANRDDLSVASTPTWAVASE